jgi:cytochrome c5
MPVGVFQAECWTHFVAFLAQPQALSDFSNPKNRMYAMQKKTVMVAVAILATLLAGCGDKKSEPAPVAAPAAVTAPAPAAAPAAPAAAENELGKSVFGKTCAMCHAAGVAGAPKPGDKADWGPRIAQGKDTMYKHAIEGFTGAKGMMPAKGGSANLTDAEVKAAVDYMADKSL